MKFSIRFADKIVGTLVVLGLALLVSVIFMLGKNQRWFIRDYQYFTYFNSASGLSVNMAVQYKGFTIGYVKKIDLKKSETADNDSVEVIFTIFEEHNNRVTEGSLVQLMTNPIGLGNQFLFFPGKGSSQLAEGSIIPEINSLQATRLIAMGLAERPDSNDSINNLLDNFNAILETVNVSLAGAQGADELALGQIVSNLKEATDGISASLVPVLENIETITAQLSSPSSAVMSALDADGVVFNSFTQTLESIAGIMVTLEKTVEFVPTQLPQIAIVISDLQSALREAEKLMIALNNNPLLRGGVPTVPESSPGAATPRNLEF